MKRPHGAYSRDEACSYNRDRERESLWQIENDQVAKLVARHPDARILDVPIGTGRFLHLYHGHSVVGADLSEAMLDQARLRAREFPELNIALHEASIIALPLPASSFDLVICWRMLHLLPPEVLPDTFGELRRVCRGTVCVQCYLPAARSKRLLARLWRGIRRATLRLRGKPNLTPWSHITSYTHSRASIEAAARGAGLQLKSFERLSYYEGTEVVIMEWSVA